MYDYDEEKGKLKFEFQKKFLSGEGENDEQSQLMELPPPKLIKEQSLFAGKEIKAINSD